MQNDISNKVLSYRLEARGTESETRLSDRGLGAANATCLTSLWVFESLPGARVWQTNVSGKQWFFE